MAIPTLLANFEGSLTAETRDSPETLTSSGPVRYVQGAVPGPEPEAVNLIQNPRAAVSTDRWFPYGASTVERDDTTGVSGATSFKVVVPNSSNVGISLSTGGRVPITTGGTYTLSVSAKASIATDLRLQILFRDGAGTTVEHGGGGFITVPVSTEWARYTRTVTATHPDAELLDFLVLSNLSDGPTFWITDVQAEEGDTATSYIDGDMGDGYRWLGTPHDSASLRESWANGGTRAYVAEEGTTNLVLNPLAMNGTANANRISAGDSIETIDDTPLGFGKSFRVTNSGEDSTSGLRVFTDTALGGTERTFTLTAYVRADAGKTIGLRLRASYDDDSVDYPAFPDVIVATGDWQAIELTGTTTAGKTLNDLSLYAYVQTDSAASSIDVHAVQIEEKPYATSFCPQLESDGSLKPGYTWAGTAHASASTREAAFAEVDPTNLVPVERGAIAIRAKLPPQGEASIGPSLFRIGTGSSGEDRIGVRTSNSSGGLFLQTRSNAGAFVTTPISGATVETWHTIIVEWDGALVRAYLDANPAILHTRSATVGSWGGAFEIGASGPMSQLNNAVEAVALFDRPLTSAERQRIVTASTWEWDTLVPRFGGIHVSAPIEPIAVAVTAGEDW